MRLRNVMDMRASYGAALIDNGIDCWVLNVPVSGPNTLLVIYDRELTGVMHDWCELFDTYARTYDLLHASGLFSIEQKRCNTTSIMTEMDRMLRPGGCAYICDTISVVKSFKKLRRPWVGVPLSTKHPRALMPVVESCRVINISCPHKG